MDSPVTFDIMGVACKLTYEHEGRNHMLGKYVLLIGKVPATELTRAPPITKENLASVCRSDVFEHLSETRTLVTWPLFIHGHKEVVSAEFNKRTQTGTVSVAGKLIH